MSKYKIMTLNMMTELPFYFGDQLFANRAPAIKELIRWNDPDLIGVQEFTDDMIPYLDSALDGYGLYGKARSNRLSHSNERNCIMYKKDRFELLDGDTFWLSETPSKCGSCYKTSTYPRIATYGILKDKKDGTIFTFCNTHLDHLLPSVRVKQCIVLRDELLKRKDGDFLLLTGDFNTSMYSEAMRKLLKDSNPLNLQDTLPKTVRSTLHPRFNGRTFHRGPVDHIFVSKGMVIHKTQVIQSLYMGVYPSDHCPVLTYVEHIKHEES